MSNENGAFLGVRCERRLYALGKTPQGFVGTLIPEATPIRHAEKRLDGGLESSTAVEIRFSGDVVLVQAGGYPPRNLERLGNDVPCLGGFRFLTGDNDARSVRTQTLGQEKTLLPPLFTQKPLFGGNVRSDVRQRVFDE